MTLVIDITGDLVWDDGNPDVIDHPTPSLLDQLGVMAMVLRGRGDGKPVRVHVHVEELPVDPHA